MFTTIFKSKKELENSALGINQRNVDLINTLNQRKHYKYADDKSLTKKILESKELACPKTYTLISRIGDIEKKWRSLDGYSSLVIKPAQGSGGGGILLLTQKEGLWYKGNKALNNNQIFSHIANIIFGVYSFGDTDKAIIEQCINPHSFFAEIYPEGVPDVRIITVKGVLVMGMLRLPTDQSDGKANLHQGGLGVGINLEEGMLTQAYNGSEFTDLHPDSGKPIAGQKLPFWDEIVQLSKEVSAAFPLNYLGIDIVLDQNFGPMVLEINVRPGLSIQLANKTGLKNAINEKLKNNSLQG